MRQPRLEILALLLRGDHRAHRERFVEGIHLLDPPDQRATQLRLTHFADQEIVLSAADQLHHIEAVTRRDVDVRPGKRIEQRLVQRCPLQSRRDQQPVPFQERDQVEILGFAGLGSFRPAAEQYIRGVVDRYGFTGPVIVDTGRKGRNDIRRSLLRSHPAAPPVSVHNPQPDAQVIGIGLEQIVLVAITFATQYEVPRHLGIHRHDQFASLAHGRFRRTVATYKKT